MGICPRDVNLLYFFREPVNSLVRCCVGIVTFIYSLYSGLYIVNNCNLGGGFRYFLFSPLFGEDSHFDENIFQMGGSTTNQ